MHQARGLVICENPIGEENYVRVFLDNKFETICSAIKKSFNALSGSNPHETYLAFYYSYQARFDYWLATNSAASTKDFAEKADDFLRYHLCALKGFDDFFTDPAATPLPSPTADRFVLKARDGGLSYRPIADRNCP